MSEDLTTWAEHYLKARDAFERKLVKMERTETGLSAEYKNRTVAVLCQPKLTPSAVPERGFVQVFTLQTDANFTVLVKEFAILAKNEDATVIFVNPKTNEKWLLKPAIHAAVADKASLKAGLTTMFQTVPTV